MYIKIKLIYYIQMWEEKIIFCEIYEKPFY